MRKRPNNTSAEQKKLHKIKRLTAESNRLQLVKMAMALAIILPVLLLLAGSIAGTSGLISLEIIVGYISMLLIGLCYCTIRDLGLVTARNKLVKELGASPVTTTNYMGMKSTTRIAALAA